MAIQDRIQTDLKTAMRTGETLVRDTLRMIIAGLENRRIELGRALDDAEVMAVIVKAVKSREDSAAQYEEAGREDLAARERAEIEICRGYLPAQIPEDEVRAIVERAVADLGADSPRSLGQVMKRVMSEHRGEVDGRLVQRIAGELLG